MGRSGALTATHATLAIAFPLYAYSQGHLSAGSPGVCGDAGSVGSSRAPGQRRPFFLALTMAWPHAKSKAGRKLTGARRRRGEGAVGQASAVAGVAIVAAVLLRALSPKPAALQRDAICRHSDFPNGLAGAPPARAVLCNGRVCCGGLLGRVRHPRGVRRHRGGLAGGPPRPSSDVRHTGRRTSGLRRSNPEP